MERTISPMSSAMVTLISPLCLGAIYAANAAAAVLDCACDVVCERLHIGGGILVA